MERLTEYWNGQYIADIHEDEADERGYFSLSNHKVQELVNKLADYEDKQEQGLLLELPYPLETGHIYFADEKDMEVYKLDAEKIAVHMMPISKKIMYTIDCYEFFIEDFGKIVFLTEAEAEEALVKMGG